MATTHIFTLIPILGCVDVSGLDHELFMCLYKALTMHVSEPLNNTQRQ
jgi:hypothetical protein